MKKICPILQAGKMMGSIGTRGLTGIHGDSQFFATISYDESSFCMGKSCEWFEHGCPAHPLTREVMEKINKLK